MSDTHRQTPWVDPDTDGGSPCSECPALGCGLPPSPGAPGGLRLLGGGAGAFRIPFGSPGFHLGCPRGAVVSWPVFRGMSGVSPGLHVCPPRLCACVRLRARRVGVPGQGEPSCTFLSVGRVCANLLLWVTGSVPLTLRNLSPAACPYGWTRDTGMATCPPRSLAHADGTPTPHSGRHCAEGDTGGEDTFSAPLVPGPCPVIPLLVRPEPWLAEWGC